MSYPPMPRRDKPEPSDRGKFDPNMLRIAKQSYRDYLDMYSHRLPRPLGVVVNKIDGRGKLIYNQLILLPQEVFVPIDLIES
ncbi:MAG: hypothetical protein ACK4QL_00240 [Pseudanabaenaceae cyanobacterium]